jgi:hypothetical protein
MATRPRLFEQLATALLALTGAGCRAELGECDQFAATQVVFLDTGNAASGNNGIPMYAGQALMHATCGTGQFCHTQDASAVERYGVPDGLYFDVQYGCDEGPCETDEEGIERLSTNQAIILEYAREILTSVRNGRMPPGGTGDRIVEQAGHFRIIDVARAETFSLYSQSLPCDHPLTSCAPGETSQEVDTPLLPAVGTREGNEVLRNWLACGAPVVESNTSDVASPPGSSCSVGSGVGHAGDCIYRIMQDPVPPAANWAAIYDGVIGPLCGESCHGAGTPNFIDESQLDLSSAQLAYDSIVGEDAKGEACAGMGTLVAPGDADASLFIDKLTRDPSCGDPMPSRGAILPEEVLAPIRAWIEAGAPND